MSIKIEIKENIEGKENLRIVKVEGNLDTATVPELEKVVSTTIAKIADSGIIMIFDFSKLNYINSTGLMRIMNYYMTMKNKGGELRIAGTSKNILEILSIVGVPKVVKVYNSVDEAITG